MYVYMCKLIYICMCIVFTLYICAYEYMFVNMYVCGFVIYVYICMHICVYVDYICLCYVLCICVYVCVYACVYVYVVSVYIFVYMCVWACVCVWLLYLYFLSLNLSLKSMDLVSSLGSQQILGSSCSRKSFTWSLWGQGYHLLNLSVSESILGTRCDFQLSYISPDLPWTFFHSLHFIERINSQ